VLQLLGVNAFAPPRACSATETKNNTNNAIAKECSSRTRT
jgi:hypothetical protein